MEIPDFTEHLKGADDEAFLGFLRKNDEAVNEASDCLRKGVFAMAVGVVEDSYDLTEERMLLAAKMNGPALKRIPCKNKVGGCGCIHAEERLYGTMCVLANGGGLRHMKSIEIYTSWSPCERCANLIILLKHQESIPISFVKYLNEATHHKTGIERLRQGGILCEHFV